MKPIEGITPDMLWTFLLVLVGLGALVVLADKVADVWRKHKKRKAEPEEKLADEISRKVITNMDARFADIDRKLANDKAMIESHTREINELRGRIETTEAGIKALCMGVLALMNNARGIASQKEMDDATATFNKYLTNK